MATPGECWGGVCVRATSLIPAAWKELSHSIFETLKLEKLLSNCQLIGCISEVHNKSVKFSSKQNLEDKQTVTPGNL